MIFSDTCGLELAQLRPGEDRIVDAIFVEALRLGDPLAQAFLGAQAPDPALLLHQGACRAAGFRDQRVVLLDASRHQRCQCLRRALNALLCRVLPIVKQPGGSARQRRQVIDRIAAMVHCVAQNRAEFARKRVGGPCCTDRSFGGEEWTV
jgi:hypothetical protein